MKKKTALLLLTAFCVCLFTACADTNSADAATDTDATSSSTSTDVLANTTWTVDLMEDYGAATQEDSGEPLTTLTLHFTDDGQAYNAVGDISFDYTLNDDGTLTLTNLNLGETHINNFELYMEDGILTMHARISGGNATLAFEKME